MKTEIENKNIKAKPVTKRTHFSSQKRVNKRKFTFFFSCVCEFWKGILI